MKLSHFAVFAFVTLVAPLYGQALLHSASDVPATSTYLAPAGDLDLDGRADFWMATANGLSVVSGLDRSGLVAAALGPFDCPYCRTAAAGDIDGDGFADVLVNGAQPVGPGQQHFFVSAYSGADGSLLRVFWSPATNDFFGAWTAALGDVDGDGWGDVEITDQAKSMHAFVFSGATGAALYEFGPILSGYVNIVPTGDVNADGFDDLTRDVAWAPAPNQVQVLSGSDLTTVLTIPSLAGATHFGSIGRAGDLDLDGHDDVATVDGANHAFVYSGATGALLLVLSAPTLPGTLVTHFSRLIRMDDMDGDGFRDYAGLMFSTPGAHFFVDAYSGASGTFLWRHWNGATIANSFENVGDVNLDGLDDLGFVAYEWTHGIGEVSVYDLATPAPDFYCTAKTNSLGCVPYVGWSGGVSTSVGDELVLFTGQMLPRRSGALMWSLMSNSAPFHGGTLCVGAAAPIVVTPPQTSGPTTPDCSGEYDFRFTKSYLAQHGLTAGAVLHCQFIARDPGLTFPDNVALTQAIAITLAP